MITREGRDPATDPELDLREFPQDPEARQPGERLGLFWERVGGCRPAPRQAGDPGGATLSGMGRDDTRGMTDDELAEYWRIKRPELAALDPADAPMVADELRALGWTVEPPASSGGEG